MKGLAGAFVLTLVFAQGAVASDATDAIDAFHADLLTAMQNAKAWGFEVRRDYLAEPVRVTFNSQIMVRLASSSYWKSFSEQQQAELSEAFYQFTLVNYASRFKGYSGQEFVTLEETPMKKGRVLVSTELIKSAGDAIQIAYVMYPDGDGNYQVIDVYLDGKFSELSQRRSEFSPILRDRGFTGLLSLLKAKVTSLEAEALNAS